MRQHIGTAGRRSAHAEAAPIGARQQIIAQQRLWAGLFEQTPLGEECDTVGEHRGEVEIMHDRHHPAAGVGKVPGDLHNLQLMRDIEARNRFVEEQPAGLTGLDRLPHLAQDAGKLNALLLAAGQLLIGTGLRNRSGRPAPARAA